MNMGRAPLTGSICTEGKFNLAKIARDEALTIDLMGSSPNSPIVQTSSIVHLFNETGSNLNLFDAARREFRIAQAFHMRR
jgi:hypothetical protein